MSQKDKKRETEMYNYDVAIIGNGILGLSTALALTEQAPALKVAIIGPEERNGGATKAAGAMLNCFGEITSSTFSNRYQQTKFDMARRALNMWDGWVDLLNDYLPAQQRLQITPGTFVILNTDSGNLDDANFANMLKALQQYQEPHEQVDPQSIPGLNPVDDHRPLSAVYIPNEGSIGSDVVWQALRDVLAQRDNVCFINEQVASIEVDGGVARGVKTRSGARLAAHQTLVTTGAFTQTLIDQIPELKRRIPKMLAGVGSSIVMEQDQSNPVTHVIRTPTRAGACGLHVVPRSNNLLYLGASNNVALTPQTTPVSFIIHFLLSCLVQINQNLYNKHLQSWTVGNRPAPIDTFPLIGSTSVDGLWLLTGTYRDGFHQSPLLAKHMASLLLGGKGIVDTSLFKPERELIQIYSKEESICEGVKHFIGGFYEHKSKLPLPMTEAFFHEMWMQKVTGIYDQLETNYGLAPDMLLMVMLDFERCNTGDIALLRDYFKSIGV
jgi:glycine/D-amino acid oxidase-like deaminating enzyme